MTERPLLMSAQMVRALLIGSKTQTRRLGNRYLKWKRGDRVWVRETWQADYNAYGAEVAVYYRADSKNQHGLWRPSIFMPRWASRITLELTADVRQEPLQATTGEDARAEGVEYPVSAPDAEGKVAPLFSVPDGLERAIDWWGKDGKPTHDDLSRLAYSLLWDSINDAPGKRWTDNPIVSVITFRVVEQKAKAAE